VFQHFDLFSHRTPEQHDSRAMAVDDHRVLGSRFGDDLPRFRKFAFGWLFVTAHELISDIFSRPQANVAGNMRYITERQFNWLVALIGADEEGGAVKYGANGGLVWMPSGRYKYVLSYVPSLDRRSIMRLANLAPSDSGTLF
jgi:hypothetical protein